jgi:hypothetical protein
MEFSEKMLAEEQERRVFVKIMADRSSYHNAIEAAVRSNEKGFKEIFFFPVQEKVRSPLEWVVSSGLSKDV